MTHSRTGRDINATALAKRIGKALDDPRIERVFKLKVRKVKPKINAAAARKTVSTVITIKQSTFTLRLFKHLKVVRTYKVAVGQPGYPTPNGRFAIQSKQIDPVWSVPNSPWAGELAGTTVGGGSAANPLKARWLGVSGSVGIHGTGQDYSIGTRASHGCIRMHVVRRQAAVPPRAARHAGPHRPLSGATAVGSGARSRGGHARRVEQRLRLQQHLVVLLLGVGEHDDRAAGADRRACRASRRACG